MIKTYRSNLIAELVTYLRPSDSSYQTAMAAFVLDVMVNVGELQLAGLQTFGVLVIWIEWSLISYWSI